MAQLTPFDIVIIQTAIEEYEQRYPDRPTPDAEAALAWRAGQRENGSRRTKVVPGWLRSISKGFRSWFPG
jgi:hypothetical protein